MQRYFSHICDGTYVQADRRRSCLYEKVAYFVFKISSSAVKATLLVAATNFNPLKPDLLTLYHRPNPIKIWPTYAVPPTITLYLRSTYDLWRAGSSPTIFLPVEKLIPLTTTSKSGADQPPLHFRSVHFSRVGECEGWSALWCWRDFRCIHHFTSEWFNNEDYMRISGTESSSVIQSQAKLFQNLKVVTKKCRKKLKLKRDGVIFIQILYKTVEQDQEKPFLW